MQLSKVDYRNGFLNTKRLIIMTDYIMTRQLEDDYLDHLHDLNYDDNWTSFKPIIQETIEEFAITHEEIQNAISNLIKVPALTI